LGEWDATTLGQQVAVSSTRSRKHQAAAISADILWQIVELSIS